MDPNRHSHRLNTMGVLKNGMMVHLGLHRSTWSPFGDQRLSVPEDRLIPPEIARAAKQSHPRGVAYYIPAKYRAAGHALAHPGSTVTGFGALALYGLPVLVDVCDTVLMSSKVGRKCFATNTRPGLTRGTAKPGQTWTVFCDGQPVSAARPDLATVQALREIRRGDAAWSIETLTDDPVFVRAVQLVDASRRFLNLRPESIISAGHRLIDDQWLRKVIRHSSALADSPKETEMRLILRHVAKEFDLTLLEQVPIFEDDRLITTLDFKFEEVPYGYMYDGYHHWTKQQRAKDSRINIELLLANLTVLRFGTGSLCSVPEITRRVFAKDGVL